MAIPHLEDLSVADFLRTVNTLASREATEKLDGANLAFGLDDEGKLFTSRESKRSSATRKYSAQEYPVMGASNPFRAAHAALEAVLPTIKEVMSPGQTVEIEVLFGKQPNAVTYGTGDKSYIAFLRGIEGTDNKVSNELTAALRNRDVQVQTQTLVSTDGTNLENRDEQVTFEFVGPQRINMQDIQDDPKLKDALNKFNEYLTKPATDLPDGVEYTNGELADLNMGSVKMDKREDVKLRKEQMLAYVRRVFMVPIKNYLTDKLATVKSGLAVEAVGDDTVGIEGVVLRDPDSGDLVKLVDKTMFTALNGFNHAMRKQIGGQVRTVDPEASLESRGGVVGHVMTHIAKVFGNPELARNSQVRKILDKYNTDGNPVNTVKALADAVGTDNVEGLKRKITAIIKQGLLDLDKLQQQFDTERDDYVLNLSNGKSIGLSDEVVSRTMLSFAEAKNDLKRLQKAVGESKSVPEVLAHVYRRFIPTEAPEEGSEAVVESVIMEKRYDTDIARYANKDAWTLLNIYFATVLMSVMMYKANDKLGLRMLKDKTHFRMDRWTRQMSPLNFWGYPIWKSSTAPVQKLIGKKTAKDLSRVVQRVPQAWYRFLHMDLSFGRDVPINWNDMYKTMKVLTQFPGMNTERINVMLKGVFGFENLTYDQKTKVLNVLHYYVAQFVPYSPLFIRLKAIQRELLFAGGDDVIMESKMKLLKQIVETAEGGAVAAGAVATAPGPLGLGSALRRGDHPNVVKRKRNPEIKFVKFKKPEDSAI